MKNLIRCCQSAALFAPALTLLSGCAQAQTTAGAPPAVRAPVVAKPNLGMTDAAAKAGLSGFYQKLMFDELNALPIKRWGFAKDEAATLNAFDLQKFEGATAQTEKLDVTGQPFERAMRISVAQKPKLFWHLNWTGVDPIGAQKGDTLWGVMV